MKNPCDASNGVPESETPDFCPVEPGDFYDPNMPSWMRLIQDRTIYATRDFIWDFGEPVNRYDERLNVTLSTETLTSQISYYDAFSNRLFIDGESLTEDFIGYWKYTITATEVKFETTFVYEKVFYLIVIELPEEPDVIDPVVPIEDAATGYLTKEYLIRGDLSDGKPQPYFKSLDAKGLLTIGWTKKL